MGSAPKELSESVPRVPRTRWISRFVGIGLLCSAVGVACYVYAGALVFGEGLGSYLRNCYDRPVCDNIPLTSEEQIEQELVQRRVQLLLGASVAGHALGLISGIAAMVGAIRTRRRERLRYTIVMLSLGAGIVVLAVLMLWVLFRQL